MTHDPLPPPSPALRDPWRNLAWKVSRGVALACTSTPPFRPPRPQRVSVATPPAAGPGDVSFAYSPAARAWAPSQAPCGPCTGFLGHSRCRGEPWPKEPLSVSTGSSRAALIPHSRTPRSRPRRREATPLAGSGRHGRPPRRVALERPRGRYRIKLSGHTLRRLATPGSLCGGR